jgi:hypothetical protein
MDAAARTWARGTDYRGLADRLATVEGVLEVVSHGHRRVLAVLTWLGA